MECPARRTGKVFPLEALYSPTPPYPVNPSLSESSSRGLAPPSKAAPEARSVEPRKSRRVISESMIMRCCAGRSVGQLSIGNVADAKLKIRYPRIRALDYPAPVLETQGSGASPNIAAATKTLPVLLNTRPHAS